VLTFLAVGAGYVLAAQGTLAEVVRTRLVDAATHALGRTVSIRAIRGGPVRGIVLEGVRIATPTGSKTSGTFFLAPRVTIHFHALALLRDVLTRHTIADSLATVEVDRPFLVLGVDAHGQWNYADLLVRQEPGAGALFTGTVEVREGTIVFADQSAHPPFSARFERITGSLDFARSPQVRISADAINTDGETPALLRIAGTSNLINETFDLDVSTRGASAIHWSPYLVPLPWLLWQGGTIDGHLHLLASPWGLGTTLDYRGGLTLHHGRATLLPQQTILTEINGPLLVDSTNISTSGLSATVGPSPIFVRGDVGIVGGIEMDLLVRSASLDLATVQKLFFPTARIHLSGAVKGEARIVGAPNALEVSGAIAGGAGRIARESFRNLSTDFQYAGGLLEFDRLNAATAGGQVAGAFRLDLEGENIFALGEAQGIEAGLLLSALKLPNPAGLRGRVSGFIAAAGTPEAVVAQGRVQMGSGAALGVQFDSAESVFWYDHGAVDVDRFVAQRGLTQVHANGQLTHTGTLGLDVVARNMDLKTVGNRFGIAPWISGTADLAGTIRGSLESPILTGELDARHGMLGPLPYTTARGEVRVTPLGLSSPLLTLREGSARYQASGMVRWDGPYDVDLSVQASEVPAQQLLELGKVPLRASGIVQGNVHFSGQASDLNAEGAMTLRDGSIEGQRVDRAQAAFHLTHSEVVLDHATAEIGDSIIEVQGSVARTGGLAISFAAQAFDLRTVTVLHHDMLRATGAIDLVGTMTGTVDAPLVNTQLTSTSLTLNGQRFDSATGNVAYRAGRLTVMPLALQQGPGRFTLSGTVDFRQTPVVNLQARVESAELTTVLGVAKVVSPIPARGLVDGSFTASGPLNNPSAHLDFHLTSGKLGDHVLRDAVVQADLANRAVTLQTFSMKPEQGDLVGAGHLNLSGTSDVEFSGRGLSLDIVRPLLGVKRPLNGDLDFTIQASGTLADPQVGISATVTKGKIGDTPFDRVVGQLFYRDGLLHVEEGLLQQDRHKVKAEGTVPFNPTLFRFDAQRPMDLRLFLADANLSVLGLFTDQVERGDGPLEGEVRITGSVDQPRMVGALSASEGTLKIKHLDPPLTDVRGRLTFDGNEIRVVELGARLGGGSVTVGGTVGIREFRPDRLDLDISVANARLIYSPWFAGVVDSELHLGGSAASMQLGGRATLSNGDLYLRAATTPSDAAPSPEGLPIGLDANLTAGDNLWVNMGNLRAQVHGAVHAGGTQQQPRLSGAVQAERGTFTAFGSTFTLVEGQATFAEFRGITPYIDARAVTHVGTPSGPTMVYVQIQGTPDDPDLLLSSDPPLPRRQIVSLLAGQAGLAQFRPDQEGALRVEFTQVLFGTVGAAIGKALGFDEFTIFYESSGPLQLRLGRLLVNNFYLTFSERFSTPDPYYAWSLEYRWTPNSTFSFSVDNKDVHTVMYHYTFRF
jgi:translocation and assembly module TamB